jgi:hypothetical protein
MSSAVRDSFTCVHTTIIARVRAVDGSEAALN